MERYNFNKKARIDLCADDCELRPTLNNIYFDEGNAIASNGNILVIAPLEEISDLDPKDIEKLNGKMLFAKSYHKLLAYDFIEIEEKGIKAHNDGFSYTFFEFEYGYKYVNYKSVMSPEQKEMEDHFSINPKGLKKICDAVCNEYPILKYNGKHQAVTISFMGSKAKGLIVPQR